MLPESARTTNMHAARCLCAARINNDQATIRSFPLAFVLRVLCRDWNRNIDESLLLEPTSLKRWL